VVVIRAIRKGGEGQPLASWVLDERQAFRQIVVLAEHRAYGVIKLKHPASGKVALFVMIATPPA